MNLLLRKIQEAKSRLKHPLNVSCVLKLLRHCHHNNHYCFVHFLKKYVEWLRLLFQECEKQDNKWKHLQVNLNLLLHYVTSIGFNSYSCL